MISYGLCKEFPALSPFDIEKKTFHDVIVLYSKIRKYQIKENKGTVKLETVNRQGKNVIRRPDGDNWL